MTLNGANPCNDVHMHMRVLSVLFLLLPFPAVAVVMIGATIWVTAKLAIRPDLLGGRYSERGSRRRYEV